MKFGRPGGEIELRVEQRAGAALLHVSDDGPGIPPEHMPHLFERFCRMDPARSGEQSGAGLGLAIVKRIAEMHGGKVEAASRAAGGACFTVSLPLVPSRDAFPSGASSPQG